LIWKTVLRTGSWRYRPGPGQRPIAKPLNVIAGHSDNPKLIIGLADIVDAFNDGAIEHVTVPTSHEDRVEENTGFIRALKIDADPKRPGESRLRAGFDFTEDEVEAKVLNGSIANTSVGLYFDYVRKDDGREYKVALAHVALTNHPWINGMEPFGSLEASEDVEVVSLEFEEQTEEHLAQKVKVAWSPSNGHNYMREQVQRALDQSYPGGLEEPGHYIIDMADGQALVGAGYGEGNVYVVSYKMKDDSVELAPKDKWVTAKQEWVESYSEQIRREEPKPSAQKPVDKPTMNLPMPVSSFLDYLHASQRSRELRLSQTTTNGQEVIHMSDVKGLESLELSEEVRGQVEALLATKEQELAQKQLELAELSKKDRERA
jgi:hypothetical protein